jgi:RNA recognition motif-containing protein
VTTNHVRRDKDQSVVSVLTVCGNNFVIQKAGPFEVVKYFRHRHITIFNLPAEMSDREVAVLFGKYGKVVRI